ncbi:hypothetical protein [Amycolatopsis sp. WGS_07]
MPQIPGDTDSAWMGPPSVMVLISKDVMPTPRNATSIGFIRIAAKNP